MNAMLVDNDTPIADKIDRYFVGTYGYARSKEIAEFVGKNFYKRILKDRNIYFGPYFKQIGGPIGYFARKYVYYTTKQYQPSATPDFFVMMYQNNNNENNKDDNDILKPISIFYYEHIHNHYPKKYDNVDYTTCTANDINAKQQQFNETNNLQSFFKELLHIVYNNEHNNVPNRVSSMVFHQCFDSIIDGTFVPVKYIEPECCHIL